MGADDRGRGLYLLSFPSWAEWPSGIDMPKDGFCLLVMADATDVSASLISRAAEHVLGSGCAYVCAWGPRCEFVHDIFDEVFVGDGTNLENKRHVMTTWHAKESLEEALWYLIDIAMPDKSFGEACSSLVVAVIGNDEWKAKVRDYLLNPSALLKAIFS